MLKNGNELNSAVGRRVRSRRNDLGISRRKLAQLSSISERYLALLEAGKANISIRLLDQIASELAMPIAAFLPGQDSQGADDELTRFTASLPYRYRQRALETLRRQFPVSERRECKGIALTGVRGAGKSTLGRHLADYLGFTFVRISDLVTTIAGLDIGELIALGGQDAYRQNEHQALKDIISRPGQFVVETSGGIVHSQENYQLLLEHFTTIWIKACPDELMQRVIDQKDLRPMAGRKQAKAELKQLIAERQESYNRVHEILDTTGATFRQSARQLEEIADRIFSPGKQAVSQTGK